jgi:hypothetical protein
MFDHDADRRRGAGLSLSGIAPATADSTPSTRYSPSGMKFLCWADDPRLKFFTPQEIALMGSRRELPGA